jgi:predicted transposase YdaD
MLEVHPSQEDQEMLMLLSQVYQEWEQVTKDQGRQQGRQEEGRSLILRLLSRKFGTIDTALHAQIDQLSLEQLEALGEALLDFTNPSDLDDWLQLNCA